MVRFPRSRRSGGGAAAGAAEVGVVTRTSAREPGLSLRWTVQLFVFGLLLILGFTTAWGVTTRLQVAQAEEDLRERLLPASQATAILTAAYADQQRGARGYLLTGDGEFLQPWREGGAQARELERRLATLLGEDGTSVELLGEVTRSSAVWRLDHAAPAIAAHRASKDPGPYVATPEEIEAGSAAFEELRSNLDALSGHVAVLTDERFDRIAAAQRAANIAVGSGVLVAVAAAVLAVVLLRRRLVRPLEHLLAQVADAARPPHPGPVVGGGPVEFWTLARGVESLRLGMHESARDLAEARRELALRQERERLAADLHDLVIQRVFALGLSLNTVAGLHPEVRPRLDPLLRDTDEVIHELREVIFDLRHGPLTIGDLGVRARTLTEDAAEVLGFLPGLSVNGRLDVSISDDAAHEAVAVLREALSNVAKHAAATAVEVSVGEEDGDLVVRVTDDGTGTISPTTTGHGLRNMRARAVRLGGRLDVDHRGQGHTLVWRVPCVGPMGGEGPAA